jgi:hypothetical protein
LVLELPASTRALGLANSFSLGFPNSDVVFYHPGLLSQAQGLSGSVQRYASHSTLAAFSAGQSWLSGGVALGVQFLTYGAAATEPVGGGDILALPTDVGSLTENGDIAVSELVLSAGYGRRVMGIQMGVVGKLVEQRFGSLRASTGALDLGVAASTVVPFGRTLTVGLAVQNLGPDMCFGDADIPLPIRFTLGAATRRAPVGPLDLTVSSAVSYRMDGDVVPSVGMEVAYWPVTGRTFVGRVGYRHLPGGQSGWPVTFGGGFSGDEITLDYAYEGFDSGSGSHRFSIGWR